MHETYSPEEIWECVLDDHLHHQEQLGRALAIAFSFFSRDTVDGLCNNACILETPIEGSFFYPKSMVRGRSVVLIHPEDLEDEDNATITIVHELCHVLLHDGERKLETGELSKTKEDECWAKVREILPPRYHQLVGVLESEGGGNRAKVSNPTTDIPGESEA